MKPLALFVALFLLSGLPVFSLRAEVPGPATTCPAPAPTNVSVLSTTSSTISLVWIGPASSGIYYEVNVYNLTTSSALPSVFTTSESTTISGLAPQNCYEFQVRASYCGYYSFGTWSVPESCCTGIIIIDDWAELPGPGEDDPTVVDLRQPGDIYLCLTRSNAAPPEFNNTIVAEFRYSNSDVQVGFGLNASSNDIYSNIIAQIGSSFSLKSISTDPPIILLKHNSTPLVEIEYYDLHAPNSFDVWAELRFERLASLQAFNYWAMDCPGFSMLGKETPDWQPMQYTHPGHFQRLKPLTEPVLSPNPFRQSAAFDFVLDQPAPVQIELYDALGRPVQVVWQNAVQAAGTYRATVEGAGLPPGLYVLHVTIDGQRQVLQVVKSE
ncbi:MAG: T9SS type A sorting domain-containing protein [Saprospiraceae bacterium]|nr:T9SS type A sorting domain-containing protein [Saprospiraceae bacterium]